MPDLSEFEALDARKGPVCSVQKALGELNGEAETLEAALTASHVTSSSIARWLEKREWKVSPQTVQRHRRGECACGR